MNNNIGFLSCVLFLSITTTWLFPSQLICSVTNYVELNTISMHSQHSVSGIAVQSLHATAAVYKKQRKKFFGKSLVPFAQRLFLAHHNYDLSIIVSLLDVFVVCNGKIRCVKMLLKILILTIYIKNKNLERVFK